MGLLEFFTGFITVCENPLWEWIIGMILASVSGSIAYAIGGQLGYSGKMGFLMWLVTALAVYAIIACVIRFIMWLISIPWWIWLIIGLAIVAIVLAIVLIVRKGNKNDKQSKTEN